MKKTDIATIVTIALLSIGAAYFLATALIGAPSSESVKIKTIDAISSAVTEPDGTVFNKDAINPTVEVIIGNQ